VTYEFLRNLEDDGLYAPEIKPHSLQKIRLHNYYVSLFATAMKGGWPQRAYLGLYSGAGRARLAGSGEIVETTALSAFRPKHPFTKYIFVDKDPKCTSALRERIGALPGDFDCDVIESDVGEAIPEIVKVMPRFSADHGLLSFCFVDPFSAALDFDVIRELATRYKMDFLVLLMLGMDVRLNFKRYLEDPDDTRIGALIGDPQWRDEWNGRGLTRKDLVRFVLEKFNASMTQLGYAPSRPADSHPIRVMGKGVFLYSLVLYSKNPLGQKFWQATRAGTSPQLGLGV